jgi:peptidoglycan/LPS O-acetylase OafA/YrhL
MSFVACYALAAASWHFFEGKILKLKSRFEYGFPSTAGVSTTPNVSGSPVADRIAD